MPRRLAKKSSPKETAAPANGNPSTKRSAHRLTRPTTVKRRPSPAHNQVMHGFRAMRFAVVRTRARGRAVGRKSLSNSAPVVGDLRIEQLADSQQGRHLRVARLVNSGNAIDPELLPTLRDAQILGMSPSAFTLAGFEVIDGVEYAQVWWCRAG